MSTQLNSPVNNVWGERRQALAVIPWQIFATFTVTKPIANGDEERRWIWREYLAQIREAHRDTLGYVWAEDRRNGAGDYSHINAHFHCVLVSNRRPETVMLRDMWKGLAGFDRRAALIEPYDPNRDGLGYVLKLTDDPDTDWDFSRDLRFFMPDPPQGGDPQSRRRYRRHMERALRARADAISPYTAPGSNSAV